MRVKKKCTECGELKSMLDFLPSEEFPDKKTRECKTCVEELRFGENNSKINNNQISKVMPTLKEKREAEAAAKAAGTTTTPVVEKKAETAATETVAKPKVVKPTAKVGDTTTDGLKVVGEKKSAGRKKQEDTKPVEQLDLETGTIVIATYPTIAAAAEAVGTNYQYLYDGLRGWTKSVAKFKWRYEGEEIFVRPVKVKTDAEKAFVAKPEEVKAEESVEETPVPGDLDYDEEELHGVNPEVEEEETDNSVFEQEAE